MRYYKGQRTLSGSIYVANIPIAYNALDVTGSGVIYFKCNPTSAEHDTIVANGYTEIAEADLITEIQTSFGSLYSSGEVLEWKAE